LRNCSSSLDNDCDGRPDNTIDTVCQCAVGKSVTCNAHAGYDGIGSCKAGAQACVAAPNGASSSLGACTGAVGPASKDTCDPGNDANCNGTVNDSACPCINGTTKDCGTALGAKGPCAAGTTTCSNANWGVCSIRASSSDTCDSGNDNNCSGTPNDGCRYIVTPTSAGNVAYDTTTGLHWRQSAATTYTLATAKADCPGGGTWRLPTAPELLTIVETSMSPTIDNAIFPNTLAGEYWTSSTSGSGLSAQNVTVSFADGGERFESVLSTSLSFGMRCVE